MIEERVLVRHLMIEGQIFASIVAQHRAAGAGQIEGNVHWDPAHRFFRMMAEVHNGKMDRFVALAGSSKTLLSRDEFRKMSPEPSPGPNAVLSAHGFTRSQFSYDGGSAQRQNGSLRGSGGWQQNHFVAGRIPENEPRADREIFAHCNRPEGASRNVMIAVPLKCIRRIASGTWASA